MHTDFNNNLFFWILHCPSLLVQAIHPIQYFMYFLLPLMKIGQSETTSIVQPFLPPIRIKNYRVALHLDHAYFSMTHNKILSPPSLWPFHSTMFKSPLKIHYGSSTEETILYQRHIHVELMMRTYNKQKKISLSYIKKVTQAY